MRIIIIIIALLSVWSSDANAQRKTLPEGDPSGISLPITIHKGRITVRAQEGMESMAKKIANASPDYLREISDDLPNLDVPERIEIRLVRKSTLLPAAAPPGHSAPSWASGVAYSDYGVVTIAHYSGAELTNPLSVTAHELSHLALNAALHNRAPRWLNEGFAYLHSSDWSAERTQTLVGMAWSGNTIPLRDLDRSFPAEEIEVHKAYAQSYDFVAFLARRGRYSDKKDEGDRWPFRVFLGRIAQGEDVDEAALKAYGTSIIDLYEEWYEDLRTRYMLIPASLIGLFMWTFAALLLIIGYVRKSRQAKRILAVWEQEEKARSERISSDNTSSDTPFPSEPSLTTSE